MDAINLLAATATIVSPTSASDQFVGHLGNACTSEELFDETLSSGMCVSVANIEPSSSMTVLGILKGRALSSTRSFQDIHLLDKKGAIYSSRPPNHIGAELITRDDVHLLLMPYGAVWRNQRKVFQTILSINAVSSVQSLQEAEAAFTVQQLSQTPHRYNDHIRRYSTAVILASVFGRGGEKYEDQHVQRLYHAQDQFTAILETGATPPVDIFPVFKRLPSFFAPWRKWALSIRSLQRSIYFELLEDVQNRMRSGILRGCFMEQLLDDEKRLQHGLDDEHLAYIGGVLMEGGSDTTASTLLSFLVAMVKYPDILHRAQEEVDKVCGPDRSPTFQDLDDLPYIKHCMSEILRWRPVAPGGIPHVLVQDDVHEGYHFTRGTIFLANAWAAHHDPRYYDRPEEFMPERFFDNDHGFKDKNLIYSGMRKTYAFGAGRRICPGQHLAENSLLINIAKLVWAFNITPGLHPQEGRVLNKEEIDDSMETQWTDGFLTAPKPFPVMLKVRSAQHQQTIDNECDAAQINTFSKYKD
ncbi:putative cytochrome P450, partial [Aureobasidium melanogenum]